MGRVVALKEGGNTEERQALKGGAGRRVHPSWKRKVVGDGTRELEDKEHCTYSFKSPRTVAKVGLASSARVSRGSTCFRSSVLDTNVSWTRAAANNC